MGTTRTSVLRMSGTEERVEAWRFPSKTAVRANSRVVPWQAVSTKSRPAFTEEKRRIASVQTCCPRVFNEALHQICPMKPRHLIVVLPTTHRHRQLPAGATSVAFTGSPLQSCQSSSLNELTSTAPTHFLRPKVVLIRSLSLVECLSALYRHLNSRTLGLQYVCTYKSPSKLQRTDHRTITETNRRSDVWSPIPPMTQPPDSI